MQNINEDFKKCNCCGRFFKNLTSSQVCINCIGSGHYDYIRIKDYLRNTTEKGTSIIKISAELNIKISKILKFVEEGSFEVVSQNDKDSIITVNDLKTTR